MGQVDTCKMKRNCRKQKAESFGHLGSLKTLPPENVSRERGCMVTLHHGIHDDVDIVNKLTGVSIVPKI